MVSAPLYGRCLLLEANLCVSDGTGVACINVATDPRGLSRGLFSQSAQWGRELSSEVGVMAELSYVHGANNVQLVGEPIFHNLRRTAARFGDRDALVVPHQDFRATSNRGSRRYGAKANEANFLQRYWRPACKA